MTLVMGHCFECLPLEKLNRPLTFVSGGVQTVGLLAAGLSFASWQPWGKLKTAELISPGAFCQSCLCGTLGPLPSYSSLSIFLFLLEAWFRSGVTRSGLFGLRCCLWLHWFLSGCLDWERQKVKAHGGEYPDGLPGLAGVLQTRVHGE